MNVLFIHMGLLGDLISSTLIPMHFARSGHKVFAVVREHFSPLYDGEGIETLRLDELLPSRLALDLAIDIDSTKATMQALKPFKNTCKLLGTKKTGGFKNYRTNRRKGAFYDLLVELANPFHAMAYYDILHALFITDFNKNAKFLHKDPALMERYRNTFAPPPRKAFVAIHIGASVAERILPSGIVMQIVEKCRAMGFGVALIGTETERAGELAALSGGYAKHIQTDLKELKSLLCAALCVIGTDSGVIHLARRLDLVTMGIYGQQLAKQLSPEPFPSRKFIALETAQDLPCRPCGFDRRCKHSPRLACYDFSPAVLDAALDKLFKVALDEAAR